jgi:hypothetical protein
MVGFASIAAPRIPNRNTIANWSEGFIEQVKLNKKNQR